MYSLSGPISPALPIASKLPARSPTIWQMIGTPACRARAQLSAFGAALSSSVNSWSADETILRLQPHQVFRVLHAGADARRIGVDRAPSRFIQTRYASVAVCWRVRHLRGVDGRRDPGVGLAQRGHELRDVGVLRLVDRGEDALDYTLVGLLSVAGRAEDPVGKNAAQDGLILVMVGIDKAGHDDHPGGVDNGRRRVQVVPDSEDLLAFDQDVPFGEVADLRIEAQYDAAFQQDAVSRVAFGALQSVERRRRSGGQGIACEQLGRGTAGDPCARHEQTAPRRCRQLQVSDASGAVSSFDMAFPLPS